MFQERTCTSAVIATVIAASMLFTGCQTKSSATPENFLKGLNAHLQERAECLFPDAPRFPFETSDPEKTKQMDTLVKAQLLTVSKEFSIHASRYTPTAIGERAAPRFCYGHRIATGIVSSTPPTTPAKGYPQTQVVYSYEVKDVPIWAKTPEVQSAFPAMAKEIAGPLTDKAILSGTIAGWQVPD